MKGIRTALCTAACLVGLALILAPTPAAADHLIYDDLIVDGSACVGFDCVNGESFGYDTIRLKEHNLRIHFDDTSSASSFPTNSWRILINSSQNGGGSYFAVEDADAARIPFTIEANARTNSLYIDDGGRLGLRTSTPSTEIHTVDGDTPTVRLQQDGSSGFAAHTWDVAGNETNFFIRDVTDGSKLPFRIRPNSATSSIDIFSDKILIGQNGQKVRVGDDGDYVGIGTDNPQQVLHVKQATSGNVALRIENDDADWDLRSNSAGDFAITAAGSGVNELTLEETTGNLTIEGGLVTGTAGSCTAASPCDGVFRPDEFTVESIDAHATYMWENEHLKGVGPTPAGEPMNLTRKTTGILLELEKAHIYIEQLHQRLARIEAQLAAAQAGD